MCSVYNILTLYTWNLVQYIDSVLFLEKYTPFCHFSLSKPNLKESDAHLNIYILWFQFIIITCFKGSRKKAVFLVAGLF